jgi:carbamoyltransferase
VTILGLSAFFHDSAACLVRNGRVVAAIQEERLTRTKNDRRFPRAAIEACLETAGLTADSIDLVAFFEKPHLKLERIVTSARHWHPRGSDRFVEASRRWATESLWLPGRIRRELEALSPSGGRRARWDGEVAYPTHHESHAASAYLPSPFDSAAILTIDGVGEWATTTVGVGSPDARNVPGIRVLEEIRFPHSLGLLYSAFTTFLGFAVNSDEYKVMGLAPFGTPRFAERLLEHVVDLKDDGSFALNMELFSFGYSRAMFTDGLAELLDVPPRRDGQPVEQAHADVAASLQKVLDEAVLSLARHARELTGERRLCLAGGVALNSVANGHLLRSGLFDDVWIQPAAGDAGGALGAALYVWHQVLGERRPPSRSGGSDGMEGALLGPRYEPGEVEGALSRHALVYHRLEDEEIVDRAAELLADGQVVAWFQGRMEFGPRALGARSILADPRPADMQHRLNAQIKFRESFRPFAPAVLAEHAGDWFALTAPDDALLRTADGTYPSPYMLFVAPVADGVRSQIPACTHVDASARIQTVDPEVSPRFAALIRAFERRTGIPVVVNTSFNLRGEPIVCSPEDAIRCFSASAIDVLAIEDFLVLRREQRPLG